ncbi:PilZ domain-containing protein [Vibrio sp. AND4]|uniref:PilZ domain-containing protein n=1 Tax=Vibrio sp. AND4 TaxID=314289 RepID=UPI00015F22D1|nr:PilZ domain-containing protein [Vibrio sp. AND4]EDP58535.1 bifunctional chorismate mutase/prephenate dehydrogenase [Vibrio sp. AND4]
MTERRRFSRIIYQAPALIEQGDSVMQATIQDLSLHGLRLQTEDAKSLDLSLPVEVGFSFTQSEQVVQLRASIVLITGNEIRLKINNIDLESISQLKRFIELNVGNDELLHRELEHLANLGEE